MNLRRVRAERLVTQAELAIRVAKFATRGDDQLTQQYISGLERGLWPARAEHVNWLAQALCVPESELLRKARLQPFAGTRDVQEARQAGTAPAGGVAA
jgi:transcriptional regulator with XRE-family HTH domain